MTDINERVKAEWKQETTARERVKEVLRTTAEYQTAGKFAERALTSEPTTRKYLEEFVEDGIGVSAQEGRATVYKRNEGRLVDERIEEIRSTVSRDRLVAGIHEMTEQLQAFRDAHGVESPEDLVGTLEAGDEGWADVGRWRSTRRNLAIAKAALQVDEAHRLVEA